MNVRSLLTSIIEGIGSLLVIVGIWQFSPSLGLIVCGLILVGIGVRNA